MSKEKNNEEPMIKYKWSKEAEKDLKEFHGVSITEEIEQLKDRKDTEQSAIDKLKETVVELEKEYGRRDGKGDFIDTINKHISEIETEFEKERFIEKFFQKYNIDNSYKKSLSKVYDFHRSRLDNGGVNFQVFRGGYDENYQLLHNEFLELSLLTTHHVSENLGERFDIQPMNGPVDLAYFMKVDGTNIEAVSGVVEARSRSHDHVVYPNSSLDPRNIIDFENDASVLAEELIDALAEELTSDDIFCPYMIAMPVIKRSPVECIGFISRYGIYDNWKDGYESFCKRGGNKNRMKS